MPSVGGSAGAGLVGTCSPRRHAGAVSECHTAPC